MKKRFFNVLGKKISIELDNLECADLDGLYSPQDSAIIISNNAENKSQVMLHELGHSALDRSGINATSLSVDMQELVVDQIATVIDENFDEIARIRKILRKK